MFVRIFRSIIVPIVVIAMSIGTIVWYPQNVFAADPTLTIVGGTALTLPANATGIAISGNYAYMSFDNSGTNAFRIIDISTPSSPSVVGGTALSFTNTAKAIAVSGNYAYILEHDGVNGILRLVNISSPASPTFVDGGSVNLPAATPTRVVVSGNYAYLITGSAIATDRFRIVDVSTPGSPSIVGGTALSIPGDDVSDIEISGSYVYLVLKQSSAGTNGLRVVDVTTPASPSFVGGAALTLPGEADVPGNSYLLDNYLYIGYTTLTANGMFRIVDISTPTSPTVTGGSSLDTGTGLMGGYVNSGYAYFAETDGATFYRLKPLNVSTVSAPVAAGSSVVDLGAVVQSVDVVGSGSYIYTAISVGSSGTNALKIIQASFASTGSTNTDFTPPDAPTKLTATSDGKTATITWADPTAFDLARIEILRNSGGTTPVDGGNVLAVLGVGVKTYTDTTVAAGQEYIYQLRAKDRSGNASISETVTVKIQKPEPVSAPVVVPTPVVVPVPIVQPTVPAVAPPVIPNAPVFSAKDNFLQNGSLATNTFGSGERAVFWREFTELYGREPFVAELDLMSNGQIHERNLDLEKRLMSEVLPLWQKLTGKKSLTNISDREQQIFDVMVYRLRFPRDIEQEKLGLTKFIRLFGYLPKTPIDWAAVRVLGYIAS